MAVVSVSIRNAVGLRNGVTRLPNRADDMDTICALLDRITVANGGSKELGGVWSTDREPLIAEIATQIATFQSTNNMGSVDSAVDPGGRTLGLMNSLAGDLPIVATVVPTPSDYYQDLDITFDVASLASMPGSAALERSPLGATFTRRLVSVAGSSIKWFGVALSAGVTDASEFQSPHVFFTPTPWQGGYQNGGYNDFSSWAKLWADYTFVVGRQIAASSASQVLVIPFYKNGQESDLGAFLTDWKDVISAVVTAAVNDIGGASLAAPYAFDTIVSSSFSNGYVAHMNFNSKGQGVSDATSVVFDLDGQAGGSTWRPAGGIIYQNKFAPGSGNPTGTVWFVGGRWGNFVPLYTPVNTHSYCVQFLLFHGLSTYC